MNKQKMDLILALADQAFTSQRDLAAASGYSLGTVNRCLKELSRDAYLDEKFRLTEKARRLLDAARPENAIILAAGIGMRMVPINHTAPKALLEVNGQPLIERLICQLRQSGIFDITVVGGFMKESLEYLIDEYGVSLITNNQYSERNNLHSLALAAAKIRRTYIVPCDIWCRDNPFRSHELYPWYLFTDQPKPGCNIRVNRKSQPIRSSDCQNGNTMIGVCYLCDEQAARVRQRLTEMDREPRFNGEFWEEALYCRDHMELFARVLSADSVTEINTYEQLRELDSASNHLKTDAIDIISHCFSCSPSEISEITTLKKGMTNRSFLFSCREKKYIMRIPGEGTDQLINRREEAQVYDAIAGKGLSDHVLYMNPSNGYKITEYIPGARVCDPENPEDIRKCMAFLRKFHSAALTVAHRFDIFEKIEFYETLWKGAPSAYRDYKKTKQHIFSLKPYLDSVAGQEVLTHIDAVYDNFLFSGDGSLRLIDWEYAAMQDPHVDLAMFCIYALYDRSQTDALIDAYFENQCSFEIRTKIYCYIACCGLLWSNWCEYKRNLGVEFGDYSLRQYRYAKEFYLLAKERMEQGEK